MNDLLHIWVNGVLILSFIFFIMSGFSSSHPGELSLQLRMIFKTSLSETRSKIKEICGIGDHIFCGTFI